MSAQRCIVVRAAKRGYVAHIHRGTIDSYWPMTDYGSAKRPTASWARRAAERKLSRLNRKQAREQRRDDRAHTATYGADA